MELLQRLSDGLILIAADGILAANPNDYNEKTDSIPSWERKGLELSDGKVVKNQIKRIVNLNAGATFDDKFNAIDDLRTKELAAVELIYDLLPATVLSVLSQDEYDSALEHRKIQSFLARQKRYGTMMNNLGVPSVQANAGKFAFLIEDLRKYQKDYETVDNKIFEAFINGDDHGYSAIPGYPRSVDFNATPALSLMGLPLWDDQNLGGADAAYKTLVTDIIINSIVLAKQYETV